MIKKYIINNYNVVSFLDQDLSSSIIDQYHNDEFKIIDIYKNKKKCFVSRFKTNLLDGEYVIKVPRSRNRGIWERFLTIFRQGESIRQFYNMQSLLSLGLKGPSPILAAERSRYGVVVDGFIVYRFIDGRRAKSSDAHLISPELFKLYNLGYTRKDPHPNNFLIAPEGVYFIDFKINKPFLFRKTRCLIECCKFLSIVPEGSEFLNELPNSITQLKFASFMQKTLKFSREIRRLVTASKFRNS